MNRIRIWDKLPFAVIFFVGFLLYFRALLNPFVWDDNELIVKNNFIKSSQFFSYSLSGGNFNSGGERILTGVYYKPLMSITYGINYRFWGLNPFGYHLFQIFLHLVNTSLVFILFKKLFRLSKITRAATWAFLPSLIFLIHPLNAEAVGYVAATQETLYTFFILLLLVLLLYLSKRLVSRLVFLPVFTTLSFLTFISKESGFILIPLGLLLVTFFAKRIFVPFLLSLTLALSSYIFLRFHFLGFSSPWSGIFPMMTASLPDRLLTLPKEFTYYLENFISPNHLAISQHWLIKVPTLFDFYLPLFILFVFLFMVLFFVIKLKSKVFLFFAVWFFGSMIIILNIVPLDMTVADRWFYFPMIGLLGMTAITMKQWGNEIIKFGGVALFLIVIVVLSASTYLRLLDWSSPLRLYSHDVKINPGAFDLYNNLGVELFRLGKYEKAKAHFEKSFSLLPNWWVSPNNLGAYYDVRNDLENAEKYYRLSITNGNYYLAYENLAFVLLRQKKIDEAITFAQKGLLLFPNNPRLILALSLAKEKMR